MPKRAPCRITRKSQHIAIAQPPPTPVSTTSRTVLSPASPRNAAARSRHAARLSALRRAGRAMVTTATAGVRRVTVISDMASAPLPAPGQVRRDDADDAAPEGQNADHEDDAFDDRHPRAGLAEIGLHRRDDEGARDRAENRAEPADPGHQ